MNKFLFIFSLFLVSSAIADDVSDYYGTEDGSSGYSSAQSACTASKGSFCSGGGGYRSYVVADFGGGNVQHLSGDCSQNPTAESCHVVYFYFEVDGSCSNGGVPGDGGLCGDPPLECPEAGHQASYQHSPGGFPVTVGGCFVTENGPASCTGGPAEEGGYCVTPVTFTGDPDPQQTVTDGFENVWTGQPDPAVAGDGTPGTNTADSASTGTSTTSTTDNGDGSSTTTTTTTNNSSTGNTDGSTTNATGTTTTSTTTNADGSTSSTTSGTGTEETEGQGFASASGNCDLPPMCSGGDPQLCAILRQNWETTCATSGNGTGTASGDCYVTPVCEEGDPQLCAILNQQFLNVCSGEQVDIDTFTADLASSGLESADDLDTILTDEEEDLSSDLNAAIGEGLGGTVTGGSCPFVDIPLLYGVSIEATKLCAVFDIMKALVAMLAYIFAAFIMFEAVRL